jgi:hypothetical protein
MYWNKILQCKLQTIWTSRNLHITVLWNLLYTTKRMMKNILFLLISMDVSFFRPSANSCIVAAEMLVFMSQRSVHVMWNFIASEWRQTHTFYSMFVCKPLLWSGTFPLTLIKYCLSLHISLSLLETFILHSLLLTVIWQEHTKQKQALSAKPKFKTLWETKKTDGMILFKWMPRKNVNKWNTLNWQRYRKGSNDALYTVSMDSWVHKREFLDQLDTC